MGEERPRRGSGVAMVATSFSPQEKCDSFPNEEEKRRVVAMDISSPFPEDKGDAFPNESEEGVLWPWPPQKLKGEFPRRMTMATSPFWEIASIFLFVGTGII